MKSLTNFGWNLFFENNLKEAGAEHGHVVRVIGEFRDRWRVIAFDGEQTFEKWATPSGRLRGGGVGTIWPSVGDFCVAREGDPGGDSNALLDLVLPRKSFVARTRPNTNHSQQMIAANVDVAFVVASMNHDFNVRKIERFLASIWNGGVTPVLILSKADLAADASAFVAEAERCSQGAEVIAASTVNGEGVARVAALLDCGKTFVVLGSSGVGKSTLINALSGGTLGARTSEIREVDHKGRHTTTSRELFTMPNGSLLIDTPGVREFGIFAAEDGVDAVFSDIEALALNCRFSNCLHGSEPDCAIKTAVESGALTADRLVAYGKLQREAAFTARKQNKALQAAEKEKWKKIHKQHRQRGKIDR